MKLTLLAVVLLLTSCAAESVTQSVPEQSATANSSPVVSSPSPQGLPQEGVEQQNSSAPEPISTPIAQNTEELPQWGSYEHCIDALQANLIRERAAIDVERYEVKRSIYLPPDEGAVAEVRYFGEFWLRDHNSVQTYLEAYCAVYEPGSVEVAFPSRNGQWAWVRLDESGYNATSEVGGPPFDGWTNF